MRRLIVPFSGLVLAVVLAACGGGGGGSSVSAPAPAQTSASSTATPTPVPAPTVTALVTASPSPAASTAATPTPAPTVNPAATFGPIPAFVATPIAVTPQSGNSTIAIAPINGITGALALGAVDPQDGLGTNYTVTLSNAPYAGVPDFAQTASSAIKGEILYLLASPPAGVNYLGGASLTLALPPKYQTASQYYIALYIAGPAILPAWPAPTSGMQATSVKNGVVTFTFPSLTLSPGYQYTIVLYGI